jgi:hypothetical protein
MDANNTAVLKRGQEEMQSKLSTVVEEVGNVSDISTKAGLTSKQLECISNLDEFVKYKMESIELSKAKPSGSRTLEVIQEQINANNKKIDFSFEKFQNCYKELEEFIFNIKIKLTGDDIYNFIDSFKAYLDTLNTYQLCILFDFFSSLLILIFIINIIFAYYGNSLIEYLNLERKLPKIAKIIEMRRKTSGFVILLNILFIIIVLGLSMYVNIVTLMF